MIDNKEKKTIEHSTEEELEETHHNITEVDEKVNLSELNTEEFLEETHLLVKEFVETKQQIVADERKIQAIGSALIAQKTQLQDIYQAQKQQHTLTNEQLNGMSENQSDVGRRVKDILTTAKVMEELQTKQSERIQTLSQLQSDHNQIIQQTTDESKKTIHKLEEISKITNQLSDNIHSMDISGRMDDFSEGILNIHTLLETIQKGQEEKQIENQETMTNLVQQVTSFREEISDNGLIRKLYDIQKASNISDKNIMDLNQKVDYLIDQFEIAQTQTAPQLEDFFSNEEEQNIEEVPEEELVDESEINEINKENDFVEETKSSWDEDLTKDSEEVLASRKEAQKDKGFFNKLFGGW